MKILLSQILPTVIALQQNCNMYTMTPLWKSRLHTVKTDKSLFGLTIF